MSNCRRELLSAFGDYRTYVEFDLDSQVLWTFTEENCDGIIKEAKEISDLPPGKEFRHVAKIPMHVLSQSFREGWYNDKRKWRQWADDPDNAAFRTWRGRLGQ